jgi:hypothetical protein
MTAKKIRFISVAALLTVAFAAFILGRHFEKQALADRLRSGWRPAGVPSQPIEVKGPSYRELRAADIIALPFSEFYEALRTAPADARAKWAAELEKMPDDPKRTAALSGFYKLLIQFDPAVAVKAIADIKDRGMQIVALDAAAKAAPGFAFPDLATLIVKLPYYYRGHSRDYLSEMFLDWSSVDPPAVARFVEEHPDAVGQYINHEEVVLDWAALDPKAAREWAEGHNLWQTPKLLRSFIQGWYESDRPAAVSYVLAHPDNPESDEFEVEGAIAGDILRQLYFDTKEEAREFIARLPDEKRREAAFHAAFRYSHYDEEEEMGEPKLSPRAIRDWMVQFPPAYWKDTLRSVFQSSNKPPEEAISWIEQQAPEIRDAVAAEYEPPYQRPLSETLPSILRVADPRLRDQLVMAVFKNSQFTAKDLDDALAAAAISAEQKNHVLEILPQVKAEPNQEADE